MQQNLSRGLPSCTAVPPARSALATMRAAGQAPASSAQASVRLLAVPDQMPPYDDAGAPIRPPVATRARSVAVSRPPEPNPVRQRAQPRQQPADWPGQFAQVLAETLAGSRPAEQLRPWTTDLARKRIRQLGPMLATGQRPRVRKIMTSAPSRDVVEMTAIVGFGPRTRVLAVRLERANTLLSTSQGRGLPARPDRHQWLCTAIESA
jgi:Family of unknown function (DUF6459)